MPCVVACEASSCLPLPVLRLLPPHTSCFRLYTTPHCVYSTTDAFFNASVCMMQRLAVMSQEVISLTTHSNALELLRYYVTTHPRAS